MADGASILIVDDSPFTLDLLTQILEAEGHEVAAATNGRSALDLVPRLQPDLILMDVGMPVLDGLQTCRILKQDRATQDIPVIFITARTEIDDFQVGYRLGCADYIRKPFQKEEVVLRVRAQLRLQRLARGLERHNQQLSAVLGVIMEGTLVVDHQGCISSANPASLDHLDYSLPELIGLPFGELAPTLAGNWKDSPIHHHCLRGGEFSSRRYSLRNRHGEILPVDLRAAALQGSDGDYVGCIVAFRDISDEQESERRLVSLLSTDPLTGLVNWKQFSDQLSATLADCRHHQRRVGVLLLDLDNFRDVNDTYGHDLGDRLLTAVAERLRASVSESILLTRLGGDAFALLLDPAGDRDQASRVVHKLLESLAPPFELLGNRIYVGASIGLVGSDRVDSSAQEMIRAADIALSHAKEQGRNRVVSYSAEMQQQVVERAQVTASLREGIDRDEFRPYFQPLVDAHTGTVVGAEALLRWRHGHELIPTERFIEAAERSGLIDELGLRVLQSACIEAAAWRVIGHQHYVSVNVSAHQLRSPAFFDQLVSALDSAHLPPEALVLELTESTLLNDPVRVGAFFERVRRIGVRLAIDDFGTGFSSLNQLSQLPVDILKIDRSFIKRMHDSPTDTALVSAIIDIADTLGIEVVAEGVEQESQRRFLADKGCATLQGFLFSQALPPEELARFVGDPV